METIEREEFTQRMRALSDDEKEIVAKTLSNKILMEELNRRLSGMADKITQIKDVLN